MKPLSTVVSRLTEEARSELEEHIAELVVTPEKSVVKRGDHVDLVVSVWDSAKGPDKFDVLVSAYDPKTAKRFTLEGFPLAALAASGTEIEGTVTARGDIAIEGLPREIETCPLRLMVAVPSVESVPRRRQGVAPVTIPFAMAALGASSGATAQQEAAEPLGRCQLAGGKVIVTVRRLHDGNLNVAAAASDESLAGATVRFLLNDPETGRCLTEGSRTLPRERNTPDGYLDSRPLEPPMARPQGERSAVVQCELKVWLAGPESGTEREDSE